MKRGFRHGGSAEEPGSPKSFWSLQIDKNSSEFAKAFGTPCPLRAGGGGFMGYRLFRRPRNSFLFVIVFVCLGICDCGIVGS